LRGRKKLKKYSPKVAWYLKSIYLHVPFDKIYNVLYGKCYIVTKKFFDILEDESVIESQ